MVIIKKCIRCKQEKTSADFYVKIQCKDGLRTRCKECVRDEKIIWEKSKKGVSYIMYKSQIQSCKTRSHPKPTYSLSQFREWLFKQEKFHTLYEAWRLAGEYRPLKPSVDRINPNKYYTFNNMQVMTWRDNENKGRKSIMSALKIRKDSRGVIKLKDNKEIKKYPTIAIAGRENNISPSNILSVCKGNRNKAGGYNWKYKN